MSTAKVQLKQATPHAVLKDGTPHVYVLNCAKLGDGPAPLMFMMDGVVYRVPTSTAPYDMSALGLSKDRLLLAHDFLNACNASLLVLLDSNSVIEAMNASPEMREEMQLASMRSTAIAPEEVISPFAQADNGDVLLDFNSKPVAHSPVDSLQRVKQLAEKVSPQIKAQISEIVNSVASNHWDDDADRQAASKFKRMDVKPVEADYLLVKLPEQAARCREFASNLRSRA